jgi:hypothetical protein
MFSIPLEPQKRIMGIDLPAAELTRNPTNPTQAVLRIQELARARGLTLDYPQATEQYHLQLAANKK